MNYLQYSNVSKNFGINSRLQWRFAPLSDLYDADVIENIVAGLGVAQRWGVSEGQLGLASKIINSQVINRIVRQHIDGEIDAATAVANMNAELAKIE